MPIPDIRISDEGSIVRLRPLTQAGRDALDRTDAESWQWFGRSLCVDHRIAEYLIDQLSADGITLEA